ncbi:MAG: hypothetical protein Q7P63_14135 [Verrucomicrobiota bacterium JB022]|nr:hypothetical protein [Verrucomicrobiota bacterium JB022]
MAIVALDTMRKRARLRQMEESPLSKATPEQFREWRTQQRKALDLLMRACKIYFFTCVPATFVAPRLQSESLALGMVIIAGLGLVATLVFAIRHWKEASKARDLRKEYHIIFA